MTIGRRFVAGRLILGRDVVASALRIAVCTGVAMLAMNVIPGARSYWIPITVAMVLKPDFGSVFARAVQRSAGTLIGVAVGVAILILLPKGFLLVLVIAVLGGLLPWTALRSFAVQAIALTALVLVLFDLIAPGPATVDYGWQRLLDTMIGSAIILVFGYLFWPGSMKVHVEVKFSRALAALDAFLEAATAPGSAGAGLRIAETRRAAYRSLSDTRTELQRALAEPPPAGREAAAWFPAVTAAERLCDQITVMVEKRRAGDGASSEGLPAPDDEPGTLNRLAARLGRKGVEPDPEGVSRLLNDEVAAEVRRLVAVLD